MDRDDLIRSVARLEAVADRFEAMATKVDDVDGRVRSLEQSRSSWRSVGRWVATIAGVVVAAVLLVLLGLKQ